MSLGVWLSPLSALYRGATSLRNTLFDAQILREQQLTVPVVSVGNITAGGTGKTPMVIHLAKQLSRQGKKIGIISRGYGRKQTGVLEVVSCNGSIYGDEPSLMKSSLPEVPVFVGGSRVEAGQALLKKYPVDLILADDAFQHRYLKRDLDIVLIDATQSLEQYRTLPSGRARESLSGLERATHLIFTKTNVPGSLGVEDLKSFFQPFVSQQVLQNALQAHYRVQSPKPLVEGSTTSWNTSQPVTLVSAIGRPEAFERQCRESLGISVTDHRTFRDHHEYTAEDLKDLTERMVLTTEKDRVKLLDLNRDFSNWFFVPLEVELGQGAEGFYEELVRLCS